MFHFAPTLDFFFSFLSHLKVLPGLLELAQLIKKNGYMKRNRSTAAMGKKIVQQLMLLFSLCWIFLWGIHVEWHWCSPWNTPLSIPALINYCLNGCTIFFREWKTLRREERDGLILLQNKTNQKMIHSLKELTPFRTFCAQLFEGQSARRQSGKNSWQGTLQRFLIAKELCTGSP